MLTHLTTRLLTISMLLAMALGYTACVALAIDESKTQSSTGNPFGAGTDSLYGGPLTEYCEKLSKQFKKTWDSIHTKENSEKWVKFRVDDTGKIVEVDSERDDLKKLLLAQKKLKNPPMPKNGKPLWLEAWFDKDADKVDVALKDVDFMPYMKVFQRQVKTHWSPPKSASSKSVTTEFTLEAMGGVRDVKIAKTSGQTFVDDAAIEAVKRGGPYPRFPDGAPDHVTIQFKFDYNVFEAHKKQDAESVLPMESTPTVHKAP